MSYETWTQKQLEKHTELYGSEATIRLMATTGRLAVVFLKHPEKLDTIAIHGMLHNEACDEIGRVNDIDLDSDDRMVAAINKAVNIDGYSIKKGVRVFYNDGTISARHFGAISWDSVNKTVIKKPDNWSAHRSLNCFWSNITVEIPKDDTNVRDIHYYPFMEHRIVYPKQATIPVTRKVLRQKDINNYMKLHRKNIVVIWKEANRRQDFATQDYILRVHATVFKDYTTALKFMKHELMHAVLPCGIWKFSTALGKGSIMLTDSAIYYRVKGNEYFVSGVYMSSDRDLLLGDYAEYQRQLSLGLTVPYEIIQ